MKMDDVPYVLEFYQDRKTWLDAGFGFNKDAIYSDTVVFSVSQNINRQEMLTKNPHRHVKKRGSPGAGSFFSKNNVKKMIAA